MTDAEYEQKYVDAIGLIRRKIIGQTTTYLLDGRKIMIDGNEWADEVVFAKAKAWGYEPSPDEPAESQYRKAIECIRNNIINGTTTTTVGRVTYIDRKPCTDWDVFRKAWGPGVADEIINRKPR